MNETTVKKGEEGKRPGLGWAGVIRRILFGIACLVTLIALFYAEEDWRGKHAWNKFKREWEAKGEKFDLQSFVPPPVPDDQNFAMTPFWEEVRYQWDLQKGRVPRIEDTNELNRLACLRLNIYRSGRGAPDSPDPGNWQSGTNTDLKAWQEYYRAPAKTYNGITLDTPTNEFPTPPQPQSPAMDVLLALSKYDNTLNLLRSAAQRPLSRFPLYYDDGFNVTLNHLARLKGTDVYLHLLVLAELKAGRGQQAQSDVMLMFYLADSVKSEPFLISYLVRIADMSINLSAIWDGMYEHLWSEAQLKEFQEKIESEDLLSDFMWTSRSGCAGISSGIDRFAALRKAEIPIIFEGRSVTPGFLMYVRFAPAGWFVREKIAFSKPILDGLAAFDPKRQRVDIERLKASIPVLKPACPILENVMGPNSDDFLMFNSSSKAIRAQTSLNLGDVACALERYWLVNGSYPEKLDALVPRFIGRLPHEIVSGEPLKYRRSEDGRFVLYSTGIEGNDSGGFYRTPDHNLTGNWVWRYSSK